MILTLLIVFISSLLLVWMGILGYYIGFALMASSLGAMIWIQIRSIQTMRSIKSDARERKAKWGGELTVVSGLSSVTGTACRLFITRYDELIVVDPISERVIPLDEIERMVLLYGKTLESMNDVQIGEAAGFHSVPRLYHVRAWIARNPRSRKRLFLAVRFRKPLTVAEYSEMAVFSDVRRFGNLDAFSLRPEIAVRTAVLPRKSNKGRRRRHALSLKLPKTQREYRDEPRRQMNRNIPHDVSKGSDSRDTKISPPAEDIYKSKFPSFPSTGESFQFDREQPTEPYLFSSEDLTSPSIALGTHYVSEGRRQINEKGLESAIRAMRESKQETQSSDFAKQEPVLNSPAETKNEQKEIVINEQKS